MNPTEAVALTRMVAAICPQQRFDEFTPDAWAMLLADVRFEDAQLAVTNLGRRQVFVAPSEILAEVRRIRDDRFARNPDPEPPAHLTPAEACAWLLETRRRIGDGTLTTGPTGAEINAAGQERVRQLVAGVGREVPTA